jgi:hypothetical protein
VADYLRRETIAIDEYIRQQGTASKMIPRQDTHAVV